MSKKQEDYTFQTYLECVNRTWKHDTEEKENAHLNWALIEEMGEFAGWMKKIEGYGKERDIAINHEILAELGDAFFYLVKEISKVDEDAPENAMFIPEDNDHLINEAKNNNAYDIVRTYLKFLLGGDLRGMQFCLQVLILNQGFTLQEVLRANVAKLKARHGDKFRDSSTDEAGRNRQVELEELIEAAKNEQHS